MAGPRTSPHTRSPRDVRPYSVAAPSGCCMSLKYHPPPPTPCPKHSSASAYLGTNIIPTLNAGFPRGHGLLYTCLLQSRQAVGAQIPTPVCHQGAGVCFPRGLLLWGERAQFPDKPAGPSCVRVSDRGPAAAGQQRAHQSSSPHSPGVCTHTSWCQDPAKLNLPHCSGCRNAARVNCLCCPAAEPGTQGLLQRNHG